MRAQLIQILKQSVKTSHKFNDYNFRSYFVRKHTTVLAAVEGNENLVVDLAQIERATKELAVIERQTTIQSLYQAEPTVVEVQERN